MKDHFGLVPSDIIQSVLAMLICRRSCRKFSMNSGSTKDWHVNPSENAVYIVTRWWNIGKILVSSPQFLVYSTMADFLSIIIIYHYSQSNCQSILVRGYLIPSLWKDMLVKLNWLAASTHLKNISQIVHLQRKSSSATAPSAPAVQLGKQKAKALRKGPHTLKRAVGTPPAAFHMLGTKHKASMRTCCGITLATHLYHMAEALFVHSKTIWEKWLRSHTLAQGSLAEYTQNETAERLQEGQDRGKNSRKRSLGKWDPQIQGILPNDFARRFPNCIGNTVKAGMHI